MFALLLLCVVSASANSLSRIVNGTPTDITAHPHQVSLEYDGGHICGGSIIASKFVLTAAHCVETGVTRRYTIGTNTGDKNANYESYGVIKITSHPDYNRNTFAGAYPNDVAVIELSKVIDTPHNKPITLAQPSDGDFDGKTCVISGWGRLSGGGTSPITLQETDGVIDSSECSSSWGFNYEPSVHICIVNKSTGSCNGDSGGPMVCDNVLAGVTSWGASGCLVSYPSVYARVSNYNSWIMGIIGTSL